MIEVMLGLLILAAVVGLSYSVGFWLNDYRPGDPTELATYGLLVILIGITVVFVAYIIGYAAFRALGIR